MKDGGVEGRVVVTEGGHMTQRVVRGLTKRQGEGRGMREGSEGKSRRREEEERGVKRATVCYR